MESTTPNGKATFTAGAAIARGEFVKFSSGKVVKASAATDVCIGVTLDSAAAAGDLVPVHLLTSGDTVIVKSGGAVAQGGSLSCLGTTVTTAGTLQYGYALEAASGSGKLIEAIVGLPAVTKIS